MGQIPVSWERIGDGSEVLWMRQNPPTFHEILSTADLAPILNLELDEFDTRYPIQEVSTGVPFIIVPLKLCLLHPINFTLLFWPLYLFSRKYIL